MKDRRRGTERYLRLVNYIILSDGCNCMATSGHRQCDVMLLPDFDFLIEDFHGVEHLSLPLPANGEQLVLDHNQLMAASWIRCCRNQSP